MNQCRGVNLDNDNIPWGYCPSFPAAVLFTVAFILLSVAHTVQAILHKKTFCWVIIMSSTWEVLGFALQSYSTQKLTSLGPFIPSQLLIILAPLWLNAFVYMVLGRMVHFFIPEKKCFGITARKLTLIFVLLDISAFLTQGSAGSMLSSEDRKTQRIGTYLYLGGIGLQEFFVLIFVCLAIRFHYKMLMVEAVHPPDYAWRPLLYCVYSGLMLITMRIIYRLCEYIQGVDTPLAKNEPAFYVLDATTMAAATFLFNVFHPGRYLVGPDSEFPKKEKKPKKSSKKKERQNDLESNTDDNAFLSRDNQYQLPEPRK